jgi:hypothetical protein
VLTRSFSLHDHFSRDPGVHCNPFNVYNQGVRSSEIEQYRRALEINPVSSEAQYNLNMASQMKVLNRKYKGAVKLLSNQNVKRRYYTEKKGLKPNRLLLDIYPEMKFNQLSLNENC